MLQANNGSSSTNGLDGATVSADAGFFTKMMSSSMDIRKIVALIGAFYWIIMTVFIVPGAIVATFCTVMVPVLCISISWHNWIDHKLCRMVNNHWSSVLQIMGMNIVEYGDDISKLSEKRVLCFANHLGIADHFVLMSALRNKGSVVEKYLWVIFNIWKMTPMGAMWIIHGNFFINGGAAIRERVLEEFKVHLKQNYWKYDHRWIIMYPEGSRLYLTKESNARFAARHGYKVFRHCALPRTGAAHAAIEIGTSWDTKEENGDIGDPIEYIVDCTLGYQNGEVPDVGNWMLGELPNGIPNVAVHYRVYKLKSEWKDENLLRDWLYKIYEEKDELLDRYYKTGAFPIGSQRNCPTILRSSVTNCLTVEAFWITLFYAHYSLWLKPASSFMCHYCFAALSGILGFI